MLNLIYKTNVQSLLSTIPFKRGICFNTAYISIALILQKKNLPINYMRKKLQTCWGKANILGKYSIHRMRQSQIPHSTL